MQLASNPYEESGIDIKISEEELHTLRAALQFSLEWRMGEGNLGVIQSLISMDAVLGSIQTIIENE